MIACIDLGLKRIGVALCLHGVVMPSKPIIRINRNQAAKEVSQRLKDHNITKLVIGVPEGGSAEDEMRRRAEHFASLLDFAGQVVYYDESFSSTRAAKLVKSRKAGRKSGEQDSAAAMIILKDYLGL